VIEALESEFAKVECFYATQYSYLRQSSRKERRDANELYPSDLFRANDEDVEDGIELEARLGVLLELLDQLEKLRWFGYVNLVASRRIIRKLGRATDYRQASIELGSLLSQQTYSQQHRCMTDVRTIESAIGRLEASELNIPVDPSQSSTQSLLQSLSKSSHGPLFALVFIMVRRQSMQKLLRPRHEPESYSKAITKPHDALISDIDAVDHLGRNPLHYAAKFGLLPLCRLLLQPGVRQDAKDTILSLLAKDVEGNTPLHLSILGDHVETTKYFVEALRSGQEPSGPASKRLPDILGSLLFLAATANATQVVQVLLEVGANITYLDSHGETVLHVAARTGNASIIRSMQNNTGFGGLIDMPESIFGRTALCLACIGGHGSVLEVLIQAGADPNIVDVRGCTAREHAAYRGHFQLLERLGATSPTGTSPAGLTKEEGRIESTIPKGLAWPEDCGRDLVPTKGQIQISLGASNTRSGCKTIELSLPSWYRDTSEIRHGLGFSLEISLSCGSGSKYTVRLPVLEDLTNRPMCFDVTDPYEAEIVIRLFRLHDYGTGSGELVGSGAAIVSTLKGRLASKHESLIRDHTIPILTRDTLEIIGRITFSFLIVSPLAHPAVPPAATRGFWKDRGQTEVVGHRGSGANTTAKTSFQIGENTIQSFLSAVASGASCVEFDVQLTKDLVPVIFHDFLIMETGGDIPLHTLTRDQFLHLSKLQSSNVSPYRASGREGSRRESFLGAKGSKPRSMSECHHGVIGAEEIGRRMKYTEEGTRNEIKGNLRGFSIQEPSTTLEELLRRLPDSVAFNLEMKYPMLWEAEDRDMDFFAMELNLFVDTILQTVYRLGAKRSITFSSFSPEICILLSVKQKEYPVLFINKAGSVPTGDLRASNLQQAMQFAKIWGLAGIVMLSDVFVLCPQLLRYAKSAGLVCGSYGNLNDDPACAKIQAEAGLDAIMVNKVRLISQELAKTGD
ncbi:MAG: hypothetical protein Q9207_007371, partial [Kuettlingeria erythrocarpa]